MHTEDRENMVENGKETAKRRIQGGGGVYPDGVTNLVVLVFRKLVDVLHVKRDG